MASLRFLICFLFAVSVHPGAYGQQATNPDSKNTKAKEYDRDYTLQATMLGYFGTDGTRNPVLKAQNGETVRITIVNGETMTHDIALEKLGLKSKVLVEKGSTTSIVFTAVQSDIYFCSIPGHRQAGMVGKFEVVEGPITDGNTVAGLKPKKEGKDLNLNFEMGSLQDWTPTGDAFTDALITADPSPVHEADAKIGYSGKYFLTSGGTKFYKKTGTLTSVPFTVTHPFAAFKVSGGVWAVQQFCSQYSLRPATAIYRHWT